MRIVIGGDTVPTPSNERAFIAGNIQEVIDPSILSIVNSSFSIFNLEAPLTDSSNPIPKNGPNLSVPLSTINGLKRLNPSLLSLANNHILDQGEEGLFSTMQILSENNLPFVGAGKSLSEASVPFLITKEGFSVGVFSCAEHEFSIASEKKAGANPFDPLTSFDDIARLARTCRYIIVLYHGGHEEYRYPSPNLQKKCHKFIDSGATIVICQHSHCIGCKENYRGGLIVYGQGNFLFDLKSNEFWNSSLLISLSFSAEGYSANFIPLQKQKEKVELANGDFGKQILEGFSNRSEEIKNPDFVQTNYQKYADSLLSSYFLMISGKKRRSFFCKLFKKLTKIDLYDKKFRSKIKHGKTLSLLNAVDCESHNELLIEILKNRRK